MFFQLLLKVREIPRMLRNLQKSFGGSLITSGTYQCDVKFKEKPSPLRQKNKEKKRKEKREEGTWN